MSEKEESECSVLQVRFRDLAMDMLERDDITGILLNHERFYPLGIRRNRVVEFIGEMNKLKDDLY